jgi:15,16-dihydrobiliverdin:ferredoxin oxidoreductase
MSFANVNTVVVLVVVSIISNVNGYVASSRSSFMGKSTYAFQPVQRSSSVMQMDYENDFVDLETRLSLERALLLDSPSSYSSQVAIDAAEAKHGMPWTTSIDKKAFKDEELLYMPFWNWHMQFIKDNLTNVKVESCSNGKTDFSYNENTGKKARIVSICLSSNEYRKIRMTYYDAGDNTQVYNAVCYPDPKYNLPILGVDLLSFNRKKYLAIVDFQPLHENESDHAIKYEEILQPIKEGYDNLKGRMSSKFYDETKFFSQQMLFARFENENIISDELLPAFKEYVQTHLDLIRNVGEDVASASAVLDRQQAYDTYSAERDPATGLFTAMFGNEWAQDFVHDFLFSMSVRPGVPEMTPAVPPVVQVQKHQPKKQLSFAIQAVPVKR